MRQEWAAANPKGRPISQIADRAQYEKAKADALAEYHSAFQTLLGSDDLLGTIKPGKGGYELTLPNTEKPVTYPTYEEANAARWKSAQAQGPETLNALRERLQKYQEAQESQQSQTTVANNSGTMDVNPQVSHPAPSQRPAFIRVAKLSQNYILPNNETTTRKPTFEAKSANAERGSMADSEDRDPGRALARLRQSAARQRPAGSGQTTRPADGTGSNPTGYSLSTLDAEVLETGIASLKRLKGAEHDVRFDPVSNRVIKLTNPGEFGAEELGLEGYLQRLVWANQLFGDDIKIEGMVTLAGESAPRVVTSQPWYRADETTPHPTQAQIDVYMRSKGFLKAYDGAYLHETRDIVASDAIPKNFILDQEGHVHPVDVVMLEPGAAQHERLQNMVNNTPQVPKSTY